MTRRLAAVELESRVIAFLDASLQGVAAGKSGRAAC